MSRAKAAFSSGCESHPVMLLQPEAIGAVMEVTKWLKPLMKRVTLGDPASVQAVTRVNAEQSSKRTLHRTTCPPLRGMLIGMGEMSKSVTLHCHFIETGNDSYRFKQSTTQQQEG